MHGFAPTLPTTSPATDQATGLATALEIRGLPNGIGISVLTAAWRITKLHYPLIFGTSLLIMVIALVFSRIPYVSLLASIPMVFLGAGQMYLVRLLIEGKPAKFKDLFHAFEDSRWMNALLPVGVTGVAIALIQLGVGKFMQGGVVASLGGGLISLAVFVVWIILAAFSVPLIAFKHKTFGDTIDLNIRAVKTNVKPLLLYMVMMFGFAFISLLCLVIPVFLVFIPVTFVGGFLIYASIFEGLDVVELAKAYDDKPAA